MVYVDDQSCNVPECLSSASDMVFTGLPPPFVMVGLNVISLSNNSISTKTYFLHMVILSAASSIFLDQSEMSTHSCTLVSSFEILIKLSRDISLRLDHRCQPKITKFQG